MLLDLAFFTGHDASEIHPCRCMNWQFVLFFAMQYFIVWLYHSLFILSAVNRHLGSLQFGRVMNEATLNIHIEFCVNIYFCFLSGIAKSSNRQRCNIIRKRKNFIRSSKVGYNILNSYKQCIRVPIVLHPCKHQHNFLKLLSFFNRHIVVYHWSYFAFVYWLMMLNIYSYVYLPSVLPLWWIIQIICLFYLVDF